MKGWLKFALTFTTAAFLLVALALPAWAVGITLTQLSTPFNDPIGIDYHEPTNSVVISVNYPTGTPHNFERINFDGTHIQFSSKMGLTEEVKIATVRSDQPGALTTGGFTVGDLFVGNGKDGEIGRITDNGDTIIVTWANLPGDNNGLLRGSLHIDRTGVWGGDLIAVTGSDLAGMHGEFWRINAMGMPTTMSPLCNAGTHLEGVTTVPNDPMRYGPLAGKIIAGAEEDSLLYTCDTMGNLASFDLPVQIEDIDIVPANENFFGVNFGTSKILGAPASDFSSIVGDILLTDEFPNPSTIGLHRLLWNGTNLVVEDLTANPGSAPVGQWEHVTFAQAGIVEIPPVVIPEPSTLILFTTGFLGLLGYCWHRKKRA